MASSNKDNRTVGQWLAIGVALGLPLGVAMGNIALGLAIGGARQRRGDR